MTGVIGDNRFNIKTLTATSITGWLKLSKSLSFHFTYSRICLSFPFNSFLSVVTALMKAVSLTK